MPMLTSPATVVRNSSIAETLETKIRERSARVAVLGLGYVGCPLAVEFAKAGFDVTGIDVDDARVSAINAGRSGVQDVPGHVVRELVQADTLRATTDFSALAQVDVVCICVPTPLRKTKDPDMSFILAACQDLAQQIHPGMLVLLESTTYPGATDEVLLPMLQRNGMEAGRDFFLCFSPERVDPGNREFQTGNIPKVVGGITSECTRMGVLFYSQALETVVSVSCTQVAEMVKLLENTFRMINVGLANEMALMCDRMGIDVWEVIDAAATKPFGFMPFYPGPGIGGHCIPIDPFYLSWKSRQAGVEARFIELAADINGQMPHFVVDKIQSALNDNLKSLRNSHIHILGVAYKRDVDDVRESPALDIIHLLSRRGARVTYSDPLVSRLQIGETRVLTAEEPLAACARADCAVIVTDHSAFDYAEILASAQLVVDTRNALKGHSSPKIVRL